MLGMAAGDSREVEITMPDTWDPPQLRGVRVTCRVAVKELFQWELPEVWAAKVCLCCAVSKSVTASWLPDGESGAGALRNIGCDVHLIQAVCCQGCTLVHANDGMCRPFDPSCRRW